MQRYCNDLDVAPGLEVLEKMRSFYTDKGIDILNDAVSLPARGELALSIERHDRGRALAKRLMQR